MSIQQEIRFGPADEEWVYNYGSRTYDLSRGCDGSAKLTMSTTRGPEDTRITIDPARTALVVVDMQNYFLHLSCRNHPTGLAAVQPTLAAIAKCREEGIQARKNHASVYYHVPCTR